VANKLRLVVALVALASLAIAPSAIAAGLQGQRVVSQPNRVATTSTLIASQAACPGQNDLGAPADAQEQAMLCMTDFARAQAGLGELTPVFPLEQSAADKSEDVLRCDNFSHFACGREFTYWMKETGYTSAPCWHVGENLAWGTGEEGSVRSIFEAWMRSPGHRANILGDYAEVGMSVRAGTLEGNAGTRVWAQHFGSHCDDPAA
jgi:uncharacterized protein YkwD